LLPVPYFHLVFTLPHDLNRLIGWYPRLIYEMLFATVSATLTEFAANPRWLGGLAAFSLVLHTWKQDLGRHVHVHALMAGGALSPTGEWNRPKRGFLFPVKALSKVFRGKFVAALKLARDHDKLQGPRLADDAWGDLIARLYAHDWVVYAKQPLGGPVQVLEYLGRYTHRVAISNERIVGMDQDSVSLRVRDWTQGNRRRTLRLPAHTFIERFLLHVLPQGFKRIRHYGLLGPAGKAVNLAQARAALSVPAPIPCWSSRWPHSCAASTDTCGRAVDIAGKAALCPRHRSQYPRDTCSSHEDRRELAAESDFVGQAWRLGVARHRCGLPSQGAAWQGLFSTVSGPGTRLQHAKEHRCASPAVTSAMPTD
jgi:hypothetical protein